MRDWNRIGFVLSSQLRFQILVKLYLETRTPTELSNLLKSPISHISRHLGELVDEGYVDCLTPNRRKNKKFAASHAGQEVIQEIRELSNVEKIKHRQTGKPASSIQMREISASCYEEFIEEHDQIVIEDRIGNKPVEIQLTGETKVKQYQPEDFELEATNVWSYPRRGNWATHKGNYRGNWPPQMVRNILLRYSQEGDTVLDQMAGSGTTLIEYKLLGRNGIGVDINKNCVMLTRDRLNFRYTALDYDSIETTQKTYLGDARNLDQIDDESIDLIATHPPYANIIPYSNDRVEGDLSAVHSINEFMDELQQVAREAYRVLKPGCYCTMLMGDTRRNKHHVPIAFRSLQTFLEEGFILKEDVMKHQWQCKATPFWLKRSKEYNFLLLKHEHLFILRKLGEDEDPEKFKESMKWW